MSSNHGSACALALAAITLLGCAREVVPGHVRARVAYTELDPTGTWVRADGSGAAITFTRPEGRNQLFAVAYAEGELALAGEALVEGTTVYATRHTGTSANDVCLYRYRRNASGALEALWGSARAVAPIAYEEAHPARRSEGWDGAYAEWGNNMGGRYHDRLIIGRALDGTPGLHRLHWTSPDHGWYRGMAFEFEGELVGVRLPGVLVHTSSWSVGSYTVTQRRTEVGRGALWFVGAYRLDGDALVGTEASNAQAGLAQVRWVRASAGGEAIVEAPAAPEPMPAPAVVPMPAPAVVPLPSPEAQPPADGAVVAPEAEPVAPDAAPAQSDADPGAP